MDISALGKIVYGMYIVTSIDGDKANGQIVNTVFQVTAEPPCLAISLNKENLTCDYIRDSKVFSVTVLSTEAPLKFIGQFGFRTGRNFAKFEGVNYVRGLTGTNIVTDYAVGYFEARVSSELDLGTHILFVGDVVEAVTLSDATAMTYDYYHQIKGGLTQKNAPTFQKAEPPK